RTARTGPALVRPRRSGASRRTHLAGRNLEQLIGVKRKCGRRSGRDQRLPALGEDACKRPATFGIELREHVVEEQQRRDAAPFDEDGCLREEQREHREPLLALRAVAPQVAVAGEDRHVVEMRAEARRAALEVPREARLELLARHRPALVAQPAGLEPELRRQLLERRREYLQRLSSRGDELRAERGNLLRPRLDSVLRGEALRDPPERGVPLPDRGAVLGGQPGARRKKPTERSVEVRPADGGRALDDPEPVRCEDERGHLRAQQLGRAQWATVQLRTLPATGLEGDLEL